MPVTANPYYNNPLAPLYKFYISLKYRLTNAILIISKFNLRNIQTLFLVQNLFGFQNSVVEKLLQLFVAVIYAKLLETVNGKVL